MRKICAIIALAVCFALVLGGCALTVDSVKKDPNAQVANAIKNTIDQLKGASPVSLPKDLNKKGTFKAKADLGEYAGEVNAELAWDKASESSALTLKTDMTDEISLYIKGNELAIDAEPLVDGVYGLNLETLLDDLKDSELFGLLGVTYDEVKDDIEKYVTEIINSKSSEKLDELTKAVKDVLTSSETVVSSEEITAGGEKVEAICVTYKLTNDNVLALADAFNVTYGDTSDIKDTISEAELAGEVKFAINPDKKVIMQINAIIEGRDESETNITLDLGKNPADSEEFKLSVSVDGEGGAIIYDRRDQNGNFCRKITVTDDDMSKTVDFVYDKENGDYTIIVDGDKNGLCLNVKGTIKSTADALTLTLDSYEYVGPESYDGEIGAEITLTNSADVPAMPEYKNLAKLSAEEYSSLMEMFIGFTGGYDDSDLYGYEFEYDPTVDYDGDGDVDDDDRQFFDDFMSSVYY